MVTSPICVDASAVIRLVTGFDLADAIREVFEDGVATGRRLVAPALFGYEVVNGLHRYAVAGALTTDEARAALEASLTLGIELVHDPELHARAMAIADQYGLAAAYDAHYVATAESRSAELLTADGRLAGLAERLGVPVRRIGGGQDVSFR